MKELFYYSIFAIVLYFVFSSVFENFNLEQENFDPSLVPVSSIVTLAKVAQKLVNGNGTLTNPGNLQIGTSTSAPGNLTVTGATTVSGNVNARNGTAHNTRIGQIWTTAGIYAESGTTGLELGAANKNVYIGAANNIDNQNLTVTGNTTVSGALNVTGEITSSSSLNAKNNSTQNMYKFIPGGAAWAGGVAENALNLYAYGTAGGGSGIKNIANFGHNGNTSFFGNVSVTGNSDVTGIVTASGVVTGAVTGGKIQIGSWGGGPALYANDSAKPLAIHNDGTGKNVQIGFPGYSNSLTVTGNLEVKGVATLSSAKVGSLTIKTGPHPNSAVFAYGDSSGWKVSFGDPNNPRVSIIDNGQICINSTCINESHLKMLTGSQPLWIGVNTSDGSSSSAAGGRTVLGAHGYNGSHVNPVWTYMDNGARVQVLLNKV